MSNIIRACLEARNLCREEDGNFIEVRTELSKFARVWHFSDHSVQIHFASAEKPVTAKKLCHNLMGVYSGFDFSLCFLKISFLVERIIV